MTTTGFRFSWPVLRRAPRAGLVLARALVGPAAAQENEIKDSVTTADGWQIPFTYYVSDKGKEAPVVILLHGEGENRLFWQNSKIGETLQKEGFAVIAPDLRKHGQAKHARAASGGELSRSDWAAMANVRGGDLAALKAFIFDEHQKGRLNMGKLAIVAVEETVPVALYWATADWAQKPYNDAPTRAAATRRGQDVRALVLVSPPEEVPGMRSVAGLQGVTRAATSYAPLLGDVSMLPSFFFIYASQSEDGRTVEKLYETAHQGLFKDRTYKVDYPTKSRGSALIAQALRLNTKLKFDTMLAAFLKTQVQDVRVPWEDRRSRLDR
jgi:pimeloyl-ACP methyl ester carboxylesterase